MKLKDRKIVITGGTKGLGKALLNRFVDEGANVAICARTQKDLAATVQELSSKSSVLAKQCDISSSSQARDFISAVIAEFGTLDILVNNASKLGQRVSIADAEISIWDEVIQTNINGAFFCSKFAIPAMIKKGSGCIINVSSSVGKAGRKHWGAFAVSKFGVEGLTQVLAEELKPFNVRVNSVNPGPMATEMRSQAYPTEDQSLLRKANQVTDIFVYLASYDGVGISGQSFDASTFIGNLQVNP